MKVNLIDVVLVDYNSTKDTIECVESLKKSLYSIRTIYIVDNSPEQDEDLYSYAVANEQVIYIKTNDNLGFSGGNNLGIEESLKNNSDYVLLLNNDTVVADDFLTELMSDAIHEKADIATGKIYYFDAPDKIWSAGGYMDWKRGVGIFYGNDAIDKAVCTAIKTINFITGCMMLIKADVIREIGVLSEEYFMYCEDVDYSLRAFNAGKKMLYVPTSKIWHKIGASSFDKNPFYFYYFLRNSLVIMKKYAGFKQWCAFLSYMPFYLSAKLIIQRKNRIKYYRAFLKGIVDGVSLNGGQKKYDFMT